MIITIGQIVYHFDGRDGDWVLLRPMWVDGVAFWPGCRLRVDELLPYLTDEQALEVAQERFSSVTETT